MVEQISTSQGTWPKCLRVELISYKTQRRLASRLSWFSKLSSNNLTKCGNRGIVIQPKHLGNIIVERTVFEELFKVEVAKI